MRGNHSPPTVWCPLLYCRLTSIRSHCDARVSMLPEVPARGEPHVGEDGIHTSLLLRIEDVQIRFAALQRHIVIGPHSYCRENGA